MSSFKSGTERPTRHPRRRPSGKGRARVQAFVCRRGFFHASAQAARLRTPTRGSMRRASGPDRSDCTHSKRKGVCMNDAGTVKSVCMDAGEIERSLTRIAHQILETNKGADKHRARGHRHPGRPSGQEAGREDRGDRGHEGAARQAGHQLLPRRLRHPHQPRKSIPPTYPSTSTARHGRAGGRRAVHRAAPSAPRSMRSWTSAGPPCGAAGRAGGPRASSSCPSAPTTWARTCPRPPNENVRLFLEEVDGVSAVEISEIARAARGVGAAGRAFRRRRVGR